MNEDEVISTVLLRSGTVGIVRGMVCPGQKVTVLVDGGAGQTETGRVEAVLEYEPGSLP
jgi:hypothetical protein